MLPTLPTNATSYVHVTLDDNNNDQAELKDVAMTQLPINMNDARIFCKIFVKYFDNFLIIFLKIHFCSFLQRDL